MNFYEILNLPRDASEDQIVRRCRSLLVRMRSTGSDDSTKGVMAYLNRVQHVLTQEREAYNQYLADLDRLRANQKPYQEEQRPSSVGNFGANVGNAVVKKATEWVGNGLKQWLDDVGKRK